MILKILKSNHAVNYFFLVLFGVAFWSSSLIKPELYPFYESEGENILFYPIHNLLENSALANVIVSLVLVLTLAVFIQQINNQYSIIRERNKLPALIFIIMVGGLMGVHTLHPVFFAGIFLTFAIYRLFSAFDQTKPYSASFDSGFLLGIGSLFYFNLLILLPAFILGIGILGREIRWRVFVIQFIGVLLPFIFGLSISVFTDSFFEIIKVFEQNIMVPNNYLKANFILQAYIGCLTLLTIIGGIILIQHYDTKKISARKFFAVFFLIFVFSVVGFIFVPATSQEMLIIIFIPVSYLFSNLITDFKRRFWSNLIFLFLFAIVVFVQCYNLVWG